MITYEQVRAQAARRVEKTGAFALIFPYPDDAGCLTAVKKLAAKKWIRPHVVVEKGQAEGVSLDPDWPLYQEVDASAVFDRVAVLARTTANSIILKGNVTERALLQGLLAEARGLRKPGEVWSHLGMMEFPVHKRVLFIADAAMNARQDQERKVAIVKNSLAAMRKLGLEKPKVALLSAIETLSAGIPSTIDAAVIAMLGQRGQLGSAIVDGPLAFDIAVSKHCLEEKGIVSPVNGEADLLVCDKLESANALYKGLVLFSRGAQAGGAVVGGRVPVALTSQSESAQNKENAITLAIVLAP